MFIEEIIPQPIASSGKSTFLHGKESADIGELMNFLASRIESAEKGDFSGLTIDEIIAKAKLDKSNK